MMAESVADTLRRASSLMRERANAVPVGPWEAKMIHPSMDGHHQYRIGNRRAPAVLPSVLMPRHDAEHVASWHPVVALAVADWLDATAAAVAAGSWPPGGALAVARAYLADAREKA